MGRRDARQKKQGDETQDEKQMGSQDARQKKGEMRHKTKQIGRQDARQKNW